MSRPATHLLVDRKVGHPTHVVMACGLTGCDEGCGEFATNLGESRLDYAENRKQVTCKRCLAKSCK